MTSDLVENLLTYGFHKLHEPEGVSLIEPEKYKLLNVEERSRDNGINDISKELSDKLNLFAQYLKNKYIDPNWQNATYNKFIIWEGVDRDNQGWHTDMFEGYDVFFLYYMTDNFPETGGYLDFKWGNSEEHFKRFYPKTGDLFLVNNCRGFWHRAGSSSVLRRVASFDFKVGLEND